MLPAAPGSVEGGPYARGKTWHSGMSSGNNPPLRITTTVRRIIWITADGLAPSVYRLQRQEELKMRVFVGVGAAILEFFPSRARSDIRVGGR